MLWDQAAPASRHGRYALCSRHNSNSPMKSLLSRFRGLALPLRWVVAPVGASLKMIISRMDFLGNCSVRHSPFDSLWGQGKVSLQRASAGCRLHTL